MYNYIYIITSKNQLTSAVLSNRAIATILTKCRPNETITTKKVHQKSSEVLAFYLLKAKKEGNKPTISAKNNEIIF